METPISKRLLQIKKQISNAERHFQRLANSVQLIAISKSQNIADIKKAIAAGQYAFGENYLQESLEKIHQLKGYGLEWHFIGRIQSNKTKLIAKHFSWVHSLSEINIAERLNSHRKKTNLSALNVCIQINIDKEQSKAGVSLENLSTLVNEINKLSSLKLRGLMAIPQVKTDFMAQRETFKKLYSAAMNLQQVGFNMDTLSMGTSQDFLAAIAEGATHIRIGNAIFGKT